MEKFITYLTEYKGIKLPPYYIGSTTLTKALSGNYFGSIKSKKYTNIFKQEIMENKNLFSLKVLSYHDTRKEALAEELKLQIEKNVVKSSEYFNESYASVNGFFGRKVTGPDNPAYGRTNKSNTGRFFTEQHKKNIRLRHIGNKHSEITKQKISESHKGLKHLKSTLIKLSKIAKKRRDQGKGNPPPPPMYGKNNPIYGTKRSEKTKRKISQALLGRNNCPKSIPVEKLDLKGILIKKYSSLNAASKDNNICFGTLLQHAKKEKLFSLNNFLWRII